MRVREKKWTRNRTSRDAAQLKREIKSNIIRILNAARPAGRGGCERHFHLTKWQRARAWIFIVGCQRRRGKTTSIGSSPAGLRREGRSVMLCARGHVSRPPLSSKLEIWGRSATASRSIKTEIRRRIRPPVVYDAVAAAKAAVQRTVVHCRYCGDALHTKSNLMAELEKMKRTAAKSDSRSAPHDVLAGFLDATTGQNGLAQAARIHFHGRRQPASS